MLKATHLQDSRIFHTTFLIILTKLVSRLRGCPAELVGNSSSHDDRWLWGVKTEVSSDRA
jgi:hypothetical protein